MRMGVDVTVVLVVEVVVTELVDIMVLLVVV
jgi:hypothetical protein